MFNKLFLSSAAVVTLLCSTGFTLNYNSASASTQTSPTSLSKASKTLAPGKYCYAAKTKTLDATATVNISAGNKVNGTVRATIQNPAESYYTSYNQTLTGQLAGDKAKLRIVTKIEYDTQNTQETWTITESKLNTGRETFTKANCETLNKETTATRKPVRVKFAAGTSSKTIEQSVIRGERDNYLVGAKKGQQMNLRITSLEKNAAFDVIAPDGKTIKEGITSWSGTLPASGDYQIVVGGTRGNATYKLTVGIK